MMVEEVSSSAAAAAVEGAAGCERVVYFFWAEWHEPSARGGQMDVVFTHLARKHGRQETRFVKVEVDNPDCADLCQTHEITTVPHFSLVRVLPGEGNDGGSSSKIIASMEGADPPKLADMVKDFVEGKLEAAEQSAVPTPSMAADVPPPVPSAPAAAPAPAPAAAAATTRESLPAEFQERLHSLINSAPVMLLMKGAKDAPRCKFSKKMVAILNENNVEFDSFNILMDEEVRQGVKVYSNWPTFPQLYANGSLVGGVDVVEELLEEEGTLAEQLGVE